MKTMPNNSMVAMLMVLLDRQGGQITFTAEELDEASHDLRHLIQATPAETPDGRLIHLTIVDRPGVELGLAGGRQQ
jgi:hypothetical protein